MRIDPKHPKTAVTGTVHNGKCFVSKRGRIPIWKYENKKVVVYKAARYKVKGDRWNWHICIIVLEIPAMAHGQQSRSDKCRASCAKVLRFETINGEKLRNHTRVFSDYDFDFTYKIGETVRPTEPYDKDLRECSSGIHFFFSRSRAARYLSR